MRKRLLAQGFVCVRRVPSRLSSQRAMLFTVLLGLAAAVDMHQKVTPVQKVLAAAHSLTPGFPAFILMGVRVGKLQVVV